MQCQESVNPACTDYEGVYAMSIVQVTCHLQLTPYTHCTY